MWQLWSASWLTELSAGVWLGEGEGELLWSDFMAVWTIAAWDDRECQIANGVS